MPRERKSSQTKTRNSKRNGSADLPPAPGSKEDRRAKLEIYLKDFDLQTTNYVKAMQAREKEMIHKLEQEWVLHRLKIPPQVMSMKLSDFMEKYNGDIAVYNRQFASADDSVENLLDNDDTDLNPKSVANNNNSKNNKNNNVVDVEKTEQELVPNPSSSSSSLSPNRKRHSDEENLESSDSLGPLPKTVASSRTLAPKFETPTAAASSTSKTGAFETPAGAAGRAPLTACTPANARAPRRSELENPNLASKLVLLQESKSGSPLAQDLSEMGTPELKKIQAQIDRMMKMKTKN